MLRMQRLAGLLGLLCLVWASGAHAQPNPQATGNTIFIPPALLKHSTGFLPYEAKYKDRNTDYYAARSLIELMGYLTKAAVSNRTAMGVSINWSSAYFLKGYALIDLERPAEARAPLDRALALLPDNAHFLTELGRAWRGMGYVLIETNRIAEAEILYRKCLELDQNDAIAKHELQYIAGLKTRRQ